MDLLRRLARGTEKTRRIERLPGDDMTKGLLCPDCAADAAKWDEQIGRFEKGARIEPEYFRSNHWSVWVARCLPCDLILYAMRFDERPVGVT
jgi:hypothetical protein